jgi:hypothetical protein
LTPLLAWWTIQTPPAYFTTYFACCDRYWYLKIPLGGTSFAAYQYLKKVTMNWAVYHDDLGFAFCF